jgi:uncharacterized membrane protein YphA (DoxX/SURF4 family)
MAAGTKSTTASSATLAGARIAVGIMFLMFAQYKLLHTDFAREGYQKWISGFVQESSLAFYKPFLRETLSHPKLWAYATGVVELLIGLSMVVGYAVRPFSLVGALFMLNLTFATWNLPAGTPIWRYAANELEHIPLLLLFLVFFAHGAGETFGLDKRT